MCNFLFKLIKFRRTIQFLLELFPLLLCLHQKIVYLTMVLLPVTEILAVIFYKENFQAEKGVAIPLSLWGFV